MAEICKVKKKNGVNSFNIHILVYKSECEYLCVLLGSGSLLLGSGGVFFGVSSFWYVAKHRPNNEVIKGWCFSWGPF
jgi:hypothetical protein